jgi:hypothetical protein
MDHFTVGVLNYYIIQFLPFCRLVEQGRLTNIALIFLFFVSGTLATGIVNIPCCIAACNYHL